MNRWIWSVSKENWEVVKGHSVWAVDKEYKARRVQDGDVIAFYVNKTGMFRGIFRVDGNWRKSEELQFGDEKAAGKKKYPYEWNLKEITIGDAAFKPISKDLGFSSGYADPHIALRGSRTGPANFGKPVTEGDMKTISDAMIIGSSSGAGNSSEHEKATDRTGMASAAGQEESEGEFGHEDVIGCLTRIGDALGFETHTEKDYTWVAEGCVVDIVWVERVGSIGTITYAFEVQSKGSIKSLITNLKQAMTKSDVVKVVAVSNAAQLEKIRGFVKTYSEADRSKFVLLNVDDVRKFCGMVPSINEFKGRFSV